MSGEDDAKDAEHEERRPMGETLRAERGSYEVLIHGYTIDGDTVTIDGERIDPAHPERSCRRMARTSQVDHVRRREALGDPMRLAATLTAYWEANPTGN